MKLAFKRTLKQLLFLDDIRRVKLQGQVCSSARRLQASIPLDVSFEVEVAPSTTVTSMKAALQELEPTELLQTFIDQLVELPPAVENAVELDKWSVVDLSGTTKVLLDPRGDAVNIQATSNNAVPIEVSVPEITDVSTSAAFEENSVAKVISQIRVLPEEISNLKLATVKITLGYNAGDMLIFPEP